jgi:ribosome biogenesis GTPase
LAVAVRHAERKGVIRAILPRKSSFSRKAAGGPTQEQVVSANVDTVFLVSGLDGGRNFNLRNIERYITVAWNSGAQPVIVLNKADLCDDVPSSIYEADLAASGVPVHAVSAVTGWGLDALNAYITGGDTVALLGHSGVGKSAIINALLGEERQPVGTVRSSDRRGRHTTTRRELILLPAGGAVIDTPGMREIQLWGEESVLRDAFDDIEGLAGNCRFADCRHGSEPGCAVRAAIKRGDIEDARFQSYLRLKRELRYLEARRNDRARIEEKERWKKISQWARRFRKNG